MPAFSLGRTQELLYELEDLLHHKALLNEQVPRVEGNFREWVRLPVILDSPLARRITGVYRELHQYWRAEAAERVLQGREPLGFRQLITIDSHAQHQQVVNHLKSTGRPAIVIAGNGMCSGGRIVNYLKAMLGDPRHQVMFVGYQAKGTPGAVMQASEAGGDGVRVNLDGQLHEVRAKVTTLGGYSGHADQAGLLRFVTGMGRWPRQVWLVHGELRAKQALRGALLEAACEAGADMAVGLGVQARD
jgi:metallo-beta-lactamase family protein